MKRLASTFLIAFAVLAPHSHATEMSSDEQTIRSLEQAWLRATTTGDKTTMRRLLDDQYVERSPNGNVRTKDEVLNAPPPDAASTQTLQILRVSVQGDTAVVLGTNQYRVALATPVINFMYMDVFHRQDNVWRVIASQISKQPHDETSK